MQPGRISPRPQLLTYPDSLGGGLPQLSALLDGRLAGLFHGVHVLPPFPSSGDRGFAPITYYEIDPRFGTWEDIRRLGERHDVVLDLMINHISRQSPEFQDFERLGRRSPTCGPVHHRRQDLAGRRSATRGPRPDRPSEAQLAVLDDHDPGDGRAGAGLDIVRHCRLVGAGRPRRHLERDTGADHGVAPLPSPREGCASSGWTRSPYVIKKPGTSCFMVEPEIYEFLALGGRGGCVLRADGPARGARHVRHPPTARRSMACGRTTSCSPD